jgi:hypothetical protein
MMKRMGSLRRVRSGLLAGLATAVTLGSLAAAPAQAQDPAPAPEGAAPIEQPVAQPPQPLPTEIGSVCLTLDPPKRPTLQRARAQELMQGYVDLGKGGSYRLGERPNWRPQRTADTSGNRHIHSLNWALPLLYRGVNTQNQAMVDRFRQLMYWWIEDHQGKRGVWVDGSIYGGLRTQTLACAAQTLNDPVIINAALRDAETMMRTYRRSTDIAIGANNTDLIRQRAAMATYCWTGDAARRDQAMRNLVGIARGIIHEDGSDTEGSPHYGMYKEKLLTEIEASAAMCGISADPIPELRGLLYQFIAQATRPDFRLESLGDTASVPIRNTFGIGDWRAEWLRTRGTSGTPPTPLYSAFDGGYVFGRASWNPAGPDTFYSLRFDSTRPATAHTHDDGAGLTLFSRGVSWIGDPGPYRYENGSSLRQFMRSRTAHSTFTISGVPRTKSKKVVRVNTRSDAQQGGNDLSCLRDNTWGSVNVTRCVTFARNVDAIIVADYITSRRAKKSKRALTQRWQLPPGVGVEANGDMLSLVSGDQRVDVAKGGAGQWNITSARSGSNVGWFTGNWGERVAGAVLARNAKIKKKKSSDVMVTVFVPRSVNESVAVDIRDASVVVTRNGTPVEIPLPTPGPRQR